MISAGRADLLDRPRHRRGLAGAGRADQRLVALAGVESLGERRRSPSAGRRSAGRRRCFQVGHEDTGYPHGYSHLRAARRLRRDHGHVRGGPRRRRRCSRACSDASRASTADSTSLVLGAATFKAARTISRDEVASFIREPFVEGEAHEGGEEPVETGDLRQAIGELVTCSRCIGTWVAGGLTATQMIAPRFGRLLTWSLAAAGANDFLQASFAALTNKSNEIEQRLDG